MFHKTPFAKRLLFYGGRNADICRMIRKIFMTRVVPPLAAGLFIAFGAVPPSVPPFRSGDSITYAVKNAGVQLLPSHVDPRILSNPQYQKEAYSALKQLLLEDDLPGNEWRNAIDAVGIIAGASRGLGSEALPQLERFASDNLHFGDEKELAPGPDITESAAAAKVEVPTAIGFLAESARTAGNEVLSHEAVAFLAHSTKKGFWDGQFKWTNSVYKSPDKSLVAAAAAALQRVHPLAPKPSNPDGH